MSEYNLDRHQEQLARQNGHAAYAGPSKEWRNVPAYGIMRRDNLYYALTRNHVKHDRYWPEWVLIPASQAEVITNAATMAITGGVIFPRYDDPYNWEYEWNLPIMGREE